MSPVVKPPNNYLGDLRYAREQSGKSYPRQIWETLRLMAGPGHISPWAYYSLRLWDPAISWEHKQEFLGENMHDWLLRNVSSRESEDLLRDKIAADEALCQAGFRTPRLLALYHADRRLESTPVLRTAGDLAAFLRDEMEYPFFYKPVTNNGSVGAGLAQSIDRDADVIERLGDPPIAVDDFAREIDAQGRQSARGEHDRPDHGYLFQAVATNHPAISELCGPTLGTFRVYVVWDDRPPRVAALNWKMPGPDSPADNSFRQGTLYVHVDLDTGEVVRVRRGRGARLEEFDENPYTGRRMTGFRVPHFHEILEIARSGAALFPGARYQGWDIGIDADGPIVIEANYGSGFDQAQISTGRGLLTPEFRDFVRRAKRLNVDRGFLWPVSWNRLESIWRLKGVADVAKSFLPGVRKQS